MNTFLARQFSGPVVQAIADGIQASFDAIDPLVAYWTDLALTSTVGPELDFMGELAGYPRPLVPLQFLASNLFLFGSTATWPVVDVTHGFGDTGDPTVGGLLSDAFPSVESSMPDTWYRQIIPLMAQVKYFGLTLYTIDLVVGNIAAVAGVTYVLSYDAKGDLVCTFSSTIAYTLLWILEAVFLKYETSCVVHLVNP